MPKTVLITGDSSGIGLATAKRFASEGWNVVATMRSPADGAELAKLGDRVLVTRLDVQDLPSIDAAVAAAVAKFGAIDVLVNNAGFGLMGIFESLSRADSPADRGQCHRRDGCHARVLPQMRKQKSGVIINVSSRTASSPSR